MDNAISIEIYFYQEVTGKHLKFCIYVNVSIFFAIMSKNLKWAKITSLRSVSVLLVRLLHPPRLSVAGALFVLADAPLDAVGLSRARRGRHRLEGHAGTGRNHVRGMVALSETRTTPQSI